MQPSAEPRPRLPHLNEHVFTTLADARRIVEAWRIDYNTVRPHGRLGRLPPAVQRWGAEHPRTDSTLQRGSFRGAGHPTSSSKSCSTSWSVRSTRTGGTKPFSAR
ncbi:MAG: transposase [Dyella sp.]|nr:transposase [Dyella sp.]